MKIERRVSTESINLNPLEIYTLLAKSATKGLPVSDDTITEAFNSNKSVDDLIAGVLPISEPEILNTRTFSIEKLRNR